MLKSERQSLILKEVNIHNKVLCSDLSNLLKVSEDTIRRDLNELAEQNQIIKVHGGALSKSFHISTYRTSDVYSLEEKTIIAGKALGLLREGMLVYISGGTTNREVARILPQDFSITFLTPSLSTALQLAEHSQAEVIFLGGRISKNAGMAVGGDVVQKISEIKADLCLLGTNSISHEQGITDSDWEVVQVKRAMIEASDKTAALTIAEKLNSAQRMKVCALDRIHYLLTELPPTDVRLRPYSNKKLKIL